MYNILHFGSYCLVRCTSGRASFRTEVSEAGDSEFERIIRFCAICYTQHNNSEENSYASKYRPWELQIAFKTNSRKDSVRLEKYLKKKDRDFIRKVINDLSLQVYVIQRYVS